jgi:hypothetical protein
VCVWLIAWLVVNYIYCSVFYDEAPPPETHTKNEKSISLTVILLDFLETDNQGLLTLTLSVFLAQ